MPLSQGHLPVLGGDPSRYVGRIHDEAAVLIHGVGDAEEAKLHRHDGVDIVLAQSVEAGGHVWAPSRPWLWSPVSLTQCVLHRSLPQAVLPTGVGSPQS